MKTVAQIVMDRQEILNCLLDPQFFDSVALLQSVKPRLTRYARKKGCGRCKKAAQRHSQWLMDTFGIIAYNSTVQGKPIFASLRVYYKEHKDLDVQNFVIYYKIPKTGKVGKVTG